MVGTALLFIFLILVVVLLFVIATACWGFWVTRVPYVRSNISDTQKILERIHWNTTDVFYDLGSGDGRVAFLVEQKGVRRVQGFELTLWTYVLAHIKKYVKKSTVQFVRKDFFKQSWNSATVIYCYLYPPLMRSIEDKFLTDCVPGTVLVSRDFPLPNLRPFEVINFTYPHNAYFYKKV